MIAIPNMEKPKSCQECPAHTFNYGYIPDHDGCRILKRAFNIDKLDINPLDEVLPDCPIIEIDLEKDIPTIWYNRQTKRYEPKGTKQEVYERLYKLKNRERRNDVL